MTKFINADHQNLYVWCRRAGIELVDAEKRLTTLSQHFGTGRRAVLRMVGVRIAKKSLDETVEFGVKWVVGHAIGDLVYAMSYTEEVIANQYDWVAAYTEKHFPEDAAMREKLVSHREFFGKTVMALVNSRYSDHNPPQAGVSLANMIIRKARGY